MRRNTNHAIHAALIVGSLAISSAIYVIRDRNESAGLLRGGVEHLSDNGDPFGRTNTRWRVVIFKNYECKACRGREGEFQDLQNLGEEVEYREAHYAVKDLMPLGHEAAFLYEVAALEGKSKRVHEILLAGDKLTPAHIERARKYVGHVSARTKKLALKKRSDDTLAAVKCGVTELPTIIVVSPNGALYKLKHGSLFHELKSRENRYHL